MICFINNSGMEHMQFIAKDAELIGINIGNDNQAVLIGECFHLFGVILKVLISPPSGHFKVKNIFIIL